MKRKRESLGHRLAKLSREEEMSFLVSGESVRHDPVEQLAREASTLRLLANALGAQRASLSESYQEHLRRFRTHVAEVCTPALLEDGLSFSRRLAISMRRVDSELGGWPEAHEVRFFLRQEEKRGRVNLSRFAERLKNFRGLQKDVRTLGRICRELNIATMPRGRPGKFGD